ncbi:YncE family protein [Mycobacterium sp. NPDC048908]|uniref:YncE family protein n=1 Tax=Mycobacterium sp. NPDC048908 TaxID=3364292 RepID=UPI003716780C
MGASTVIERALARALSAGITIAMSAQPAVATARRGPEDVGARPSAGWVSALAARFGALGRKPSASGRVIPAAAVGSVAGIGSVRDIALSPDGRYAYVAASRDGCERWAVYVVDTDLTTVITTIDGLSEVIPTGLAVSPDSSRLYVADRNAAAIRVVDISEGSPTRNRVVDSLLLEGSLPVGYGTPTSIILSPTGSRLYALMTDPAVLILDPESRVLVRAVSGGDSIAMFTENKRVYVCAGDRLGHTNVTAGVVILDADTGTELGSFGLNDAPAFIRQPILAGGDGRLYLDIDDLDGHLEVVDTSALNVVARIRIDASADRQLRSIPSAAVLSPDGRCLYVANQGVRLSSDEATEVGWISVIDTRRNQVVHDITLPATSADEYRGASPQFITISPAGDRLVVVNEYGVASVIDIASGSVLSTVTLGKSTDRPRVVIGNPTRNAVYVGGDSGLTVIPV